MEEPVNQMAGGYFFDLAGVILVEFENVAVFDHDSGLDGAGFHEQAGVTVEIAIVAVNRDKELGPDEVDERPSFPGYRDR